MAFRTHLDSVLRTSKGRRVLDEAARLARDPVAKQRIEELRLRMQAAARSRQRRD